MVWSLRGRARLARRPASLDAASAAGFGADRRQEGVSGERLARVDEVQVAALDRGLGLQLARAAARR